MQDYRLASLPRENHKLGPKAIKTLVSRANQAKLHQTLWSYRVAGLALQLGKAAGQALKQFLCSQDRLLGHVGQEVPSAMGRPVN